MWNGSGRSDLDQESDRWQDVLLLYGELHVAVRGPGKRAEGYEDPGHCCINRCIPPRTTPCNSYTLTRCRCNTYHLGTNTPIALFYLGLLALPARNAGDDYRGMEF